MELAPYLVSVNLVFFAGSQLHPPPPPGEEEERYVKIRKPEEAQDPQIRSWIEQAAEHPGWSWENRGEEERRNGQFW